MNEEIRRRSLTVGEVIQKVFPDGTLTDTSVERETENLDDSADIASFPTWEIPPVLPYDMFAVCGYLIHNSGLMGFFAPDPGAKKTIKPSEHLRVNISIRESLRCAKAGKAWREKKGLPTIVGDLWLDLIEAWNLPARAATYQRLHRENKKKTECPPWWNAVFQLFIIADEACDEVGHVYFGKTNLSLVQEIATARLNAARTKDAPLSGDSDMKRMSSRVATYTASADAGTVCVQPKARVSRTGCTLRNLSRNLALTGPVGTVRCSWSQLVGKPKAEEDEGLDIVLIPMPYEMPARYFKSAGNHHSKKHNTESAGWGNFDIDQAWLHDKKTVLEHVTKLIAEAKKDVETVNAVIFPELALNYDMFRAIRREIVKEEPDIEFVIAGSSTNCEGESCNCVITALWDSLAQDDDDGDNTSRVTSQRKHHRWRLERSQLSDYALSARLHPDKDWWENHSIGQRELNFFQFRKSSVFASLICEDLARSDPVHDIVRSVAPNLLFALLMDGAQIERRWPARYASTLADDPGTSVLTLTSYGLIRRVNENSRYAHSDSIGLWKDETGRITEVKLPSKARGVLLSLSAQKVMDITIDGRVTADARSWRLDSQKPLYID